MKVEHKKRGGKRERERWVPSFLFVIGFYWVFLPFYFFLLNTASFPEILLLLLLLLLLHLDLSKGKRKRVWKLSLSDWGREKGFPLQIERLDSFALSALPSVVPNQFKPFWLKTKIWSTTTTLRFGIHFFFPFSSQNAHISTVLFSPSFFFFFFFLLKISSKS